MKSKKLAIGLLIFYLAALTWIIVFKMQFSMELLGHIRNINLIPFGQSVIVNGHIQIQEIVQNALAFVPYGLLIHVLLDRKPFLWQLLPIVLTSLIYEAVQYIFAIGASDMTDLIMNSLGGLIGIGIAVILSKIFRKNWKLLIHIICLIGAVLLGGLILLLLLAN